jgi:hypothetical protein
MTCQKREEEKSTDVEQKLLSHRWKGDPKMFLVLKLFFFPAVVKYIELNPHLMFLNLRASHIWYSI